MIFDYAADEMVFGGKSLRRFESVARIIPRYVVKTCAELLDSL